MEFSPGVITPALEWPERRLEGQDAQENLDLVTAPPEEGHELGVLDHSFENTNRLTALSHASARSRKEIMEILKQDSLHSY